MNPAVFVWISIAAYATAVAGLLLGWDKDSIILLTAKAIFNFVVAIYLHVSRR